MSISRAHALCIAAVLSVFSRPAASQRVTGVVRDSASREPIPSAVVRLFDASGRELERTITGRDGRYRLDALQSSRQLRVVRIGFRPRTIPLSTAIGRDTAFDIVLVGLPTLLEAVTVNDQPQCSRRSDRAAALALWEQARAALLAAIVAREARPPSITAITYDRTLDRRGRVIRQHVHHDSLPTTRPFIAARSVAEFRETGYADGATSQRTYYAPDADILLDQSFGDGHCFSIREDKRAHPGQIGLVFEPAHDRAGIIDVSGVMWLDVSTPALRTVEFHYTNVEPVVRNADAGGLLSFRTASNGLSVIDRWNLHLPSIAQTGPARRLSERPSGGSGRVGSSGYAGSAGPSDDASRWQILDVHDVGAVIATAVWPDGSQWHSALGTLRGQVVRPQTTSGVAGVLVWLMGSDDSTRTAGDGAFELTQLLPGPYPLFAAEEPGAHFTFQQNDTLRVEVDSVVMPPLRIPLPALDERIKAFCKGTVSGPGRLLVLGEVLLPDGSAASGATVEAFWDQSANGVGRAYRMKARTDTSGTFHVCGLRAEEQVHTSVVLDSLDATVKSTFAPHQDSLLSEVHLNLAVPAFRTRFLRVVDASTGEPIRGVSLIDDESGEVRSATNAEGEASLGWLPRGRSTVVVQRPGYESASVSVTIDPKDLTIVRVTMRRAR